MVEIRPKRIYALASIAISLPAAAGCPGLKISDAWIRETPPGVSIAAGYLTISNSGDTPAIISGISSPDFARAEFHSMSMENGSMHMEQLDKLTVPAHGQFLLNPDGNHIMLFDPRSRIKAGKSFSLRLTCAKSTMTFKAAVRRFDKNSQK